MFLCFFQCPQTSTYIYTFVGTCTCACPMSMNLYSRVARALISGAAVGFGGGIRFASNFQPDYSSPPQARTFSKTIVDLYYSK